jgi:hypothetical protein
MVQQETQGPIGVKRQKEENLQLVGFQLTSNQYPQEEEYHEHSKHLGY